MMNNILSQFLGKADKENTEVTLTPTREQLKLHCEKLRAACGKACVIGGNIKEMPPIWNDIDAAAGHVGSALMGLYFSSTSDMHRSYIVGQAVGVLQRIKDLLESPNPITKSEIAHIWDLLDKITGVHLTAKALYIAEAILSLKHIKDVMKEIKDLLSGENHDAHTMEEEEEGEEVLSEEEASTVEGCSILFSKLETLVHLITRCLMKGEETENVVNAIKLLQRNFEAVGGNLFPPHEDEEIQQSLLLLQAATTELLTEASLAGVLMEEDARQHENELQKIYGNLGRLRY